MHSRPLGRLAQALGINMQPKDAFGVVVRVIGLLVSCTSLLYLLSAVLLLFVPNYRADVSPAWHYLLSGIVCFVLGAYLLRGAPHIVRFAYPQERSDA